MGFIIHFYIIFGTNLLTQRPSPACFRVLQKKNIKRSPNGMKPSREIFLEKITHGKRYDQVRGQKGCPRGWGRPPFPGRAPLPRGWPVWPRCPPSSYIYLRTPETPYAERKSQFHRRSCCSRGDPILEPVPELHRRGIHHGGLLHHHHRPHHEL